MMFWPVKEEVMLLPKYNIKIYGLLVDIIGSNTISLIINSPKISVSKLLHELYKKYPELKRLKIPFNIYINGKPADNIECGPNDEIALLPPGSGG